MILSHRAALGGVQLDSVDSLIMVKGVSTQAPRENDITAPVGGNGLRFIRKKRESLEVQVRIGLRLFDDDMDDREELLEAVNGWAGNLPAWFTTTQKPDRRLWVESVQQPAAGDPYEWTNEYTYTFRALAVPYWQKTTATSVTLAAADSNTKTITVPGTAETVLDMELTNGTGNTINDLTIAAAGGGTFTFESLGLANGEKLVISHSNEGLLNIEIVNGNTRRNAMDKRTGASSNDMIILPGSNKQITITAAGAMTGTISCYGRYK